MSHLLFIDGHNILYRALHGSLTYDNDGKKRTDESKALETEFTAYKDAVLESLFGLIKHFRPTDVIWAADFGKSWRYDIFPEYKAKRKASREDDIINHEAWKKVTNEFFPHLMYAFPNIRFIHADRAEGDDVIGVGVAEFGGNYNKISLISSDEDLLQLHTSNKITQWKYNSTHKKYTQVTTADPVLSREVKIIAGDTSDSIPNMRVGTGPAGAVDLLAEGFDEWANKQANKDVTKLLKENNELPNTDEFRSEKMAELIETWKSRIEFNRQLIDMRMIPEWVRERIIMAIKTYQVRPMPVADRETEFNLFNFFRYHKTIRAMDQWDAVAPFFAAINRGK